MITGRAPACLQRHRCGWLVLLHGVPGGQHDGHVDVGYNIAVAFGGDMGRLVAQSVFNGEIDRALRDRESVIKIREGH